MLLEERICLGGVDDALALLFETASANRSDYCDIPALITCSIVAQEPNARPFISALAGKVEHDLAKRRAVKIHGVVEGLYGIDGFLRKSVVDGKVEGYQEFGVVISARANRGRGERGLDGVARFVDFAGRRRCWWRLGLPRCGRHSHHAHVGKCRLDAAHL